MEIIRRDRSNRHRVDRLRASGAVVRVLPAIFAHASVASTWMARVAALAHFDPSAVITREAAAAAQWWPGLEVGDVTASRGAGSRTRLPGFVWEQRRVEDIRVVDGVQFASPATTVLDLLDSLGEQALFEALRRRVVSVDQLQQALPANARGVRAKRALLAAASDEPWSALEFQAHRHLREAGVTGWKANYKVKFDRFLTCIFDLAFPKLRLALEFDGWSVHGTRAAFSADRSRDVGVGRHGWSVYRFDALALDDGPGFVSSVRDLIAIRAKVASR